MGPRRVLGVVALVVVVLGCGSSAVDSPRVTGLSDRLLDYLRSPLEGYRAEVSSEWAGEIRRAHDALVNESATEVARAAGQALEARLEGFLPANVLLAQVDFVAGDYLGVVDRLEPLLTEQRGYVAGQLLLGRAAELVGEPVVAFRAYRRAEPDSLARMRGEAVSGAATQTLAAALEEALQRGRVDQVQTLVDELVDWDAGSATALSGRWQLARLQNDAPAELSAVRDLNTLEPDRREWSQRRAELEVEVGDPKTGVDLYQALIRRFPNDPLLDDRLASAKFRWRLQMLPEPVVSLIGPREMTRGDFATLLFWLIPGARTGQAPGARIASDVPLEHPQREAIVRVINLGLLEVADPTLHQFAPNRQIRRVEALGSLVGWLSSEATCAEAVGLSRAPSEDAICEAAARCQLIREVAECLPRATLSGVDARESIRRALDVVSGSVH